MDLVEAAVEEFRKSPVATICAPVGLLIALASFAFGWLQSRNSLPPVVATEISFTEPFYVTNALLVVSFFLGLTIPLALLLRYVGKRHGIAAFFASIPLLALTNFLTVSMIHLVPPRPITSQLFVAANDLVLAASAAVVLTFCGKAILSDLFQTAPGKSAPEQETTTESLNGLSLFAVAGIALMVWCWLVSAGQQKLVSTMLPEVTHTSSRVAQPEKIKPVSP